MGILLLILQLVAIGLLIRIYQRSPFSVPASTAQSHTDDPGAGLVLAPPSRLLLMGPDGLVQHEITIHSETIPGDYVYAGKRWIRQHSLKSGAHIYKTA